MQIPEDVLKKWKALRSYGDNRKIAEKCDGVIEMDVTRAFTKGECSDTVFVAIAGFYKEREETVKQYL
jgi:hypothetical protein